MVSKKRRSYSNNFKRKIIQLLNDGVERSKVVNEYGISKAILSKWLSSSDKINDRLCIRCYKVMNAVKSENNSKNDTENESEYESENECSSKIESENENISENEDHINQIRKMKEKINYKDLSQLFHNSFSYTHSLPKKY